MVLSCVLVAVDTRLLRGPVLNCTLCVIHDDSKSCMCVVCMILMKQDRRCSGFD